jgi:phthalate 4,5-dioxygenase reductase subunit
VSAGMIGPTNQLRLARKAQIARDIFELEFRRADAGDLPAFTAGAHIQIQAPNALLRKYSLCNDPAERQRYVIAVKHESAGRGGSRSLIEEAKIGDDLPVSEPVNNFGLSKRAQALVLIAGGIGITPIMSMIRHLKSVPEKQFKLYYCTRTPEATAFRDELSVPELRNNVKIHHDDGDPEKALDLWPILEQRKNLAHLYCCGPRALMEAVRDMSGHWPPSAVHFEAFGDAETRKPDDTPFTLKLARSGEIIDVAAGQTILEAMRARGVDAPSSCESGTCGTCRTRLLSGEADHRDLVLADSERGNQIMICVSRARSAQLVIDR